MAERLRSMLSDDHQALADRLADRAMADRTVARMKRRAWRKTLSILLVAALGAALAAWQSPELARLPMVGSGELAGQLSLAAEMAFIALVLGAVVISLPDID